MPAQTVKMETTANLTAVRRFHPSVHTVADGIRRMLEWRRHEPITVARLLNSYGGNITEEQVQQYGVRAGILAPKPKKKKKICVKCEENERKGGLLCSACRSHAPTDAPGQTCNAGPGRDRQCGGRVAPSGEGPC